MNKKEIEAKLQIQDNEIKFLAEEHRELYKKVRGLERTRDTFLENKTPNELRANVGMNKLDTNLYIDMYELSKNRCPRCGSHHLFYEFHGNSLEDSKVYCKDCGNHWQFGKSDVAPINPYDEVKELSEMLDKKQFAYDDCYEELERARDRIKNQNSKIAILEKENEKFKTSDTWVNWFKKEELIEQLKEENAKLNKELLHKDESYKTLTGKYGKVKEELLKFKAINKNLVDKLHDCDGWKDAHDYIKEICDRQQKDINILKEAVKAVFNKFSMTSEYCDGTPFISELVIDDNDHLCIRYDRDKDIFNRKPIVSIPITIKDHEILAAAWNIANNVKNK